MHALKLHGPVGGEHFSIRLLNDLPPGPIKIIIDSGGGCSISGHAIYNQLRDHQGKITVEVARAGSAAVLPMLAGDQRTINGGGWIFIHRHWATTIGTSPTLIKAAESLAEWDAAAADVYAERTGLSLAQIFKLMDEETTLGPAEAVELGFAHEVLGPLEQVTRSRSLDRTALECLNVECAMTGPVMSELRTAAKPIAARNTDVDHILSRPIARPNIQPDHAGDALDRFCENERREQQIQQHLITRLKRAIDYGGHITWPLRMTWECEKCKQTNFGPPAQNRLAKLCAYCAQISLEEKP